MGIWGQVIFRSTFSLLLITNNRHVILTSFNISINRNYVAFLKPNLIMIQNIKTVVVGALRLVRYDFMRYNSLTLHDVNSIVWSNMAEAGECPIQFAPFSSAVDAAFWHRLTKNKLEVYQLDDKPKPIRGYYVNSKSSSLVHLQDK